MDSARNLSPGANRIDYQSTCSRIHVMRYYLGFLACVVNLCFAQLPQGNSAKGIYFGSAGATGGDSWAIVVSRTGDASFFFVGPQSRQISDSMNFSLNTDGTFSIPGHNVSGRIASGVVTLNVPQGPQLTAPVASANGPHSAHAGYYVGTAHERNGGAESLCLLVLTAEGQALCYFVLPTQRVDGAVGRIQSSSRINLTSMAGEPAIIEMTEVKEGGSLTGTYTTLTRNLRLLLTRKNVTYRLANLATRGLVSSGGNTLVAGFVISGGAKSLLIRAAGPALSQFGVAGALGDPQLSVFNSAARLVASNDNWTSLSTSSLPSSLVDATTRAGAFAFSPGSRDSAVLVNLEPGNYTAEVSGMGGATGVALVEVYELD